MLKSILIGRDVHWYFDSRFFTVNNTRFEIVGTTTTGPGSTDCQHRIKNVETGEAKEISMTRLVNIINSKTP